MKAKKETKEDDEEDDGVIARSMKEGSVSQDFSFDKRLKWPGRKRRTHTPSFLSLFSLLFVSLSDFLIQIETGSSNRVKLRL